MITILTISVIAVLALIKFGIFGIAQSQTNNITSITPEQKTAIYDPNNPKLKVVNTTESRICGIPVTVKPPANATSSSAANTTTTGTQALGGVVSSPP